MGFELQDGTGSKRKAEVDTRFRLKTFAVSQNSVSNAGAIGNSYNANTGIINLTSGNKSAVFYIKNNGNADLIIDSLFYLLGNSTGGTGDVLITVLKNPTTGTLISNAVVMEMPGVNRNFGSGKLLNAEFYKGVEGDTFTNGEKVIESIFNQSPIRAAVGVGAIHLPKGTSLGIEITPGTGNTNLDVEFAASIYLEDE